MRASLPFFAAAILVTGGPAIGLEVPSAVLARPSVDQTLFRDGEVRRRNETFGRWSLDCDEVPRLAQRFCSLRSVAFDERNTPVARVTISTDDAGRPAALLDFPPSTDLLEPVIVTAATPLVLQGPSKAVLEDVQKRMQPQGDRRRRASPPVKAEVLSTKLSLSVCEPSSCQAIWSLKPTDIAALRAGSGLRMRFKVVVSSLGELRSGGLLAIRTVEGLVLSDGFDDAIKSSVQ